MIRPIPNQIDRFRSFNLPSCPHTSPQAFYAIFLATPIFFLVGDPSNAHMLGQPFDAGRYFLFLALLALLATLGAALGLMVGSLVKDVQQGQQVRESVYVCVCLSCVY